MEYKFFGAKTANVKPITKGYELIANPRVLYDYMDRIWCEHSCAPRMRKDWSENNKTLGQCSITSFLIQDIFGGKVYGVPLKEGGFHCYNVVGNCKFDLTSEQFGDERLVYTDEYEQSREEHFASLEKYERYLFIKTKLIDALLMKKNEPFVNDVNANIKGLEKGQSPYMMVISCSDSRVAPEKIFNVPLNELFVIRTAGNVVNEGELATVEYGIEHLKIKYVLVLGHTGCGAIHATMHHEKGKYLDPILGRIAKNIGEIKDDMISAKMNAQKEACYLREKFPGGNVIFDSAVYDIASGKVIFD